MSQHSTFNFEGIWYMSYLYSVSIYMYNTYMLIYIHMYIKDFKSLL